MTVCSSPTKSVKEGHSGGVVKTVQEVIKNLSETSGIKRGDVVKQIRGLNTRLSDSDDIESILLIRKYEKENTELKDQVKTLEERIVGDELIIMNLNAENEDLKNQVGVLNLMVQDLEKENQKLKNYVKTLEGKTASDELVILNLSTENENLMEMIEKLKSNKKGFPEFFKSIYSSYNLVRSCAHQARHDPLSVNAANLLTVVQLQLQNYSEEMRNHCEHVLRKVPLPQVPSNMEALLTSILPSRLIIPIKQVDILLENIPIVKAVSGQTYKPSAEAYCSQGQTGPLVGQDAYATHCGLLFKPWNSSEE